MSVRVIRSAQEEQALLNEAGSGLLVIKFTASWCPPCHAIQPTYERLARATPQALFASCDTDAHPALAQKYGVTAMPTFTFIKNKQTVAELKGADASGLTRLVQLHASAAAPAASGSGTAPASAGSLVSQLDKSATSCLNEHNDHTHKNLFQSAGYLESDADEQLILSLPTQTSLKIKALRFTTAKEALAQAPKSVKLFIDRPDLGFDEAETDAATQQFELTEPQALGEELVELRFVKFVKVTHLTVVVLSNQGEQETTRIDRLDVLGEVGAAAGSLEDAMKRQPDE